jgi:branched-chain amino acid transport system permease protein
MMLNKITDMQKNIAAVVYYFAAIIILLLGVTNFKNEVWFYTYNIFSMLVFVLAPFAVLNSPLPKAWKWTLLGVFVCAVMPLIGLFNGPYLELFIQICIFAGLALGLNIVVGFTGLLDLGYVAFFATGAYLWGMFTSATPLTTGATVFQVNGWIIDNPWMMIAFIFIGVIVAALVGVLLGLPVLRLRGDYLAIVTLGFGEVIRILARNGDAPVNLTNGSQGLSGILSAPQLPGLSELTTLIGQGILRVDAAHPTISNPDTVAQQFMYYILAMVVLGIILLVSSRLEDSPIGRAWTAIREDEVAARAMGVNLLQMKILAFATGASFGGAMGTLYAAKQTFIDPNSFVLLQSISILAMVIVGGLGSIRGVLLGAAVVVILDLHVLSNFSLQINALKNADAVIPLLNLPWREFPNQLDPAKYQPLLFGLILVLMMIFRPSGLIPNQRQAIQAEKRPTPPPPPAQPEKQKDGAA